ncbi:hypothetical protein [Shigella phage ESh24]|nr:hypothetical protein [Shigella phage ESh24]
MRIIIVLRPWQFYGVPLECYFIAASACYPEVMANREYALRPIYPSVYILSSSNRTRNL